MKHIYFAVLVCLFMSVVSYGSVVSADTQSVFIHPGGLHTLGDLNRMRAMVAAGRHPWIDSWDALIANPKAQDTYTASPMSNMGTNRQRASADAVAAYLNALRWYISGDTRYADCAVRICNGWSSKVKVVSTGRDGGLDGIATYEFAVAGEVLRLYPGWKSQDFARFKGMLENYSYPASHDFLTRHDGTPITHYWANWDICNMDAILAIGVLCDDRAKFDEAITYFKHGAGNGAIEHAIPYVYDNGMAQWQEMGRDQEHAQLGLGMMATFCQIAWNQGIDLYSYDDNRLLKAAEYVAAYNMWKPVPYTFYTNADQVNNYWPSDECGFTGGNRGRLQRPIWEMIYNHYCVLQGLKAPYLKEMAEIYRPEGFEHDDNLGFGTLCYTLDAKASPYPPAHVPPVPQTLTATASVGCVWLTWTPSETANGYTVRRADAVGGPYKILDTFRGAFPTYQDNAVTNGRGYFYKVSAINQRGESGVSLPASATPEASGALPSDWAQADIGDCAASGSAGYAPVDHDTFVVSGTGAGLGVGQGRDGVSFVYKKLTGDFTFTARRSISDFKGAGHQRIGLLVRDSLDPASKSVAMISGDVGAREARFGARTDSGARMTWQLGNGYTLSPTWFRIQCVGNLFTAYQSINGFTWFAVGKPYTVPMTARVDIGFCVSSNGSRVDDATFDNVSIQTESH